MDDLKYVHKAKNAYRLWNSRVSANDLGDSLSLLHPNSDNHTMTGSYCYSQFIVNMNMYLLYC